MVRFQFDRQLLAYWLFQSNAEFSAQHRLSESLLKHCVINGSISVENSRAIYWHDCGNFDKPCSYCVVSLVAATVQQSIVVLSDRFTDKCHLKVSVFFVVIVTMDRDGQTWKQLCLLSALSCPSCLWRLTTFWTLASFSTNRYIV